MNEITSLNGALIRDMRRFQRAAGAADRLHQSDNGKCRECANRGRARRTRRSFPDCTGTGARTRQINMRR